MRFSNRTARGVLLNAMLIVGATVGGMMLGAVSHPATAQGPSCENDGCSRVCSGSSCTWECFDWPGSEKGCNMQGGECSTYNCDPQ